MSMIRKRVQPYIRAISPGNLTILDKQWLDKAVKKDYYGTTVSDILNRAITGYCQIWRLGESEGIIVSEVVQHGENWVLVLSHMAGKGVVKRLDYITDFYVRYAKSQQYKVIEFASISPAMERIYKRRYKKVATIFVQEL